MDDLGDLGDLDMGEMQRQAIAGLLRDLNDEDLHHVAELVRQLQTDRAITGGDHDAIIGAAFEIGFGRDGLGVLPWVEGNLIICPGGMVSKGSKGSRASHRCRFVSIDDCWSGTAACCCAKTSVHRRVPPRASAPSRSCRWSTVSTSCPAGLGKASTRSNTS